MGRILTVPNLLSLSRLILIWPIVVSLNQENILLFSVLGIIAVLTDFLDGYLSRVLNQGSDVGKVIDPIVDGTLILSILVILFMKKIIPIWYPTLIVIRYAITFLLLSHYQIKTKQVPQSIQSGKWSMCGIVMVIIVSTLMPHYALLREIMLLASSALLIISLFDYFQSYKYTKS